MAATTYECSECGALLKSPQELPAGKKIRCPKCSKVFIIGGEPAAKSPAVAVKAKPAPAKAVPPPVAANADDDDEGGSYVLKADDGPPPPTLAELTKSKKKKSEDDEDEDDDFDDDDKPAKKKKKKAFKQKKSSSSGSGASKVVLILAGVLLLFLLAGAGGGAYVYLNWYKNRGTGNEDPLAFLPADCTAIGFINAGAISSRPGGSSLVQAILKAEPEFFQKVKSEAGIEPQDLADQIWLGGKAREGTPGQPPIMSIVFKSKVPFDQNKMRLAFKEATTAHAGLRAYFKINLSKGSALAYMPSDRILFLSDVSEADFVPIISSKATKPIISADLLGLAQTMDKEDVWAVVGIDEKARQQMKGPAGLPPGMGMPPGLDAGLAKAKAAGFGAAFVGSQVKFTATVDCGTDAASKRLADELEGMWNKQKGMLGIAAMAFGKSGSVLAKDLTQSLRIASKGSFANATAQVSFEALKDSINEGIQAAQAAQQQPGARRGNRGPGPGGPGFGGPDGLPGGRPGGFGGRRGGRDGR
jgi:DNA-directed RNA polymerase subunit RPC12/RpoP